MKRKNGALIIKSKNSYVKIRQHANGEYLLSFRDYTGHWELTKVPFKNLEDCKISAKKAFDVLEDLAYKMLPAKQDVCQGGSLSMARVMQMRSKERATRTAQYLHYCDNYRKIALKSNRGKGVEMSPEQQRLAKIFELAEDHTNKKYRENADL